MAKLADKDFLDIMSKQAEREAYGSGSTQCPICGMAVGGKNPRMFPKESMFEDTYGQHLKCGIEANTPESAEFTEQWNRLNSVHDKIKERAEQAQQIRDQAAAAPAVPAEGTHILDQKPEEQTIGKDEVGSVGDVLGAPAAEVPAEDKQE